MRSSDDTLVQECTEMLEALQEFETTALIPHLLRNKKYPATVEQLLTDIPNKLYKIITTNFSYKRLSSSEGESYEMRYIGEGASRVVSPQKDTTSMIEPTYILRYKKNNYTLDEAKKEIEKKESIAGAFLVTSNGQQ